MTIFNLLSHTPPIWVLLSLIAQSIISMVKVEYMLGFGDYSGFHQELNKKPALHN